MKYEDYCGLTEVEVQSRIKQFGQNISEINENSFISILFNQLKNALTILLIIVLIISFFAHDPLDSIVIVFIIIVNTLLGGLQEYKAKKSLEKLKQYIKSIVKVIRESKLQNINKTELVPNDLLIVRAGDIVPADAYIIEQESIMVDESSITGESTIIHKKLNPQKDKDFKDGVLFAGTAITKGEAIAEIFATGRMSKFGKIIDLVENTSKETEYEESLKSITKGFVGVAFVFLIFILGLHLVLAKNENFATLILFGLAIAITIIPESLPVVITLTLTNYSHLLSKKGVIVKRASSIEDLGNIDILCSDKTGTLTKNNIKVSFIDSINKKDISRFLLKTSYNSDNPFDESIIKYLQDDQKLETEVNEKYKDIPFSPENKYSERIFKDITIRKGAPEEILKVCELKSNEETLKKISSKEQQGYKAISIATKNNEAKAFEYLGTIYFTDEIKEDVKDVILKSKDEGVEIKIITGDSLAVAAYVGLQVNLISSSKEVINSSDLAFDDEIKLAKQVKTYKIFARTDPVQKYKIIESLQKTHHVGYLGDGINDAPSLKLANVSIVVDSASDIAKSSSDIILTDRDLHVILEGILDGRKAFENVDKYVKHTLVGNFGNFFTIGILSVFLNFLPMLPIQILLSNLLSSLPSIALSTDNVDSEELIKPKKHNIWDLLKLAILLGAVSSIFDFLFFLLFYKNEPYIIQTSWFIFSILTEVFVIFSIRTRKFVFFGERPALQLFLLAIISVFTLTVLSLLGVRQLSIAQIDRNNLVILFILSAFYFYVTEFFKGIYFYIQKRKEII